MMYCSDCAGRDARIAELEAKNRALREDVAMLTEVRNWRDADIASLKEQRNRMRDALAWCAHASPAWSLFISPSTVAITREYVDRADDVFEAIHDGTGPGIERALLEAVDAARKAE